jgi:uncharacterized coiled-coil protein SlyX
MQFIRIRSTLVASAIVLLALAAPVLAQTAVDTSSKDSSKHDDVSLLKQQIAEQQKEIEQLRAIVDQMKEKLDHPANPTQTATSQAPTPPLVASTSPMVPKSLPKTAASSDPNLVASAAVPRAAATPSPNPEPEPPLQFHIGTASITPVGFMDFTSVFRTHAAGGSIGTSFGSIPYGTNYQTNLSETRLSMQNSRIGFRTDADVMGAHVIGYMEADFLGNNGTNVAVTSNSNTLRSRLYWVDILKSKWELLGGQTWSLITPGRNGISPLPSDVFYTQDMDVNYQAGLFWGRIPELRFVYHPAKQVALAVALDSPDQYAGGSSGGPTITLPSALSSTYASELDTSASSGGLGAPNVAPDVIVKLALDPNKRVHFEIGGVERHFKVWYPGVAAASSTAAIPASTFSTTGGGGFLNLHVEIFKGFRLMTNNFWSDGGGRYIFGQAPDLVAKANGSISLLHSGSTITGFEFSQKKTLIFGYYGGIYVGRDTVVDTNGKLVGYGYSGAPTSQNRTVQEATLGFNQAVWKNPKYGAVNVIGQYSYLTRGPWYVASGQPTNASLNMVFFDLRYTLPGSAPTLGGFAR